MTYITCIGDLGWRGEGYNHSLVFDVTLTEKLNYVFQTDFVGTDTDTANDDLSVNQYLFYTLNDCWKFGTRVEWWQRDGESLWEAPRGELAPASELRPAARNQVQLGRCLGDFDCRRIDDLRDRRDPDVLDDPSGDPAR